LQAEPLRDAVGWLETYRQFWEGSFDQLEARLSDERGKPVGG
jgi:hypothetical protein